jgi:uncharacterized protein
MTRRQEIVLAALAPARGAGHSPVQVQKLLFLLDREIPDMIGGPYFNFMPYNYGPFDKSVYDELEALAADNFVAAVSQGAWRRFCLTPAGQDHGDRLLNALVPSAREYIVRASEFVRSQSFASLVAAIYKAYPEMKENSVFQN